MTTCHNPLIQQESKIYILEIVKSNESDSVFSPMHLFFLNIFKGIKAQHPSHDPLTHRFCAKRLQACVGPVQLHETIQYISQDKAIYQLELTMQIV